MDRKEHGDPDGLLLKAQNIILFSLTNFYYDDDRKFYKILSFLTFRRIVVRLGTSVDFSLRFFSKPSEPTELQNQELESS